MSKHSKPLEGIKNINLIEKYYSLLVDYRRGVASNWRLVPLEIEDAYSVGFTREEIEEVIKELQKRGLMYDKAELVTIDNNWKEWLKGCIDDGDVEEVLYPNDDEPVEKWWLHIENSDNRKI